MNIINKRYGHLVVISESEKVYLPCGQPNRVFLCKCDCGREKNIRMVHLTNYRTTTCGCMNKDVFGECKTPLYIVWNSIKTRTKKNHHEHKNYFDRGIRVCDEWANSFQSFKAYATLQGFKKGLTIDRINNDKGYEPGNIRFVPSYVNVNNRRNTCMVEYNGKSISLQLALRQINYKENFTTIYARIKRGYSFEDAIKIPIKNNYKGRIKSLDSPRKE